MAKDQREDGGVEKASMAISLGKGHKESRPKEIRLCLMQGEQRRDSFGIEEYLGRPACQSYTEGSGAGW